MKITELFEGFPRSFTGPQTNSGGKGPQWTTAELADKFGFTSHELTALRKKYPGFPEPTFSHNNSVAAGKRTYYDLKLANRWFADVKAKVQGDIDKLKSQL